MCPYFHFPVDDGISCYFSRGYQSLEELNLNKESPENSKFCSSTKSACYAFTGELLKELLNKYLMFNCCTHVCILCPSTYIPHPNQTHSGKDPRDCETVGKNRSGRSLRTSKEIEKIAFLILSFILLRVSCLLICLR